jgi:hypothetical protein
MGVNQVPGTSSPSLGLNLGIDYYFEGNWAVMRYDDPELEAGLTAVSLVLPRSEQSGDLEPATHEEI